MELGGRQTVVVGMGVSGQAATRFLRRQGARVRVLDSGGAPQLAELARDLEKIGARVRMGPHRPSDLDDAELIVLSPGVPHRAGFLASARRRGVPVWGELELAARFLSAPVLAVTGTNGKTTVTTLLGHMLSATGRRVFVGGNIGTPLTEVLNRQEPVDVVVAEVSSFQLDTADTFRPAVAVLLNLAPDHLDRYAGFDDYAAAKGRIFARQQPQDAAVVNAADPTALRLAQSAPGRRLFFGPAPDGIDRAPELAARISGRSIAFHTRALDGRKDPWQLRVPEAGLPGGHNVENAAAAALAALAAGTDRGTVARALENYPGLAHRLTTVAEIDGIRFVNDSKATNVAAVMRALQAFSAPLVLIMGGRDKGSDFSLLAEPVAQRARAVVTMGEAAAQIGTALRGAVPVHSAADMPAAVATARRLATGGDVVLLSPACASFDMFDGYAQRGAAFCRAVEALR